MFDPEDWTRPDPQRLPLGIVLVVVALALLGWGAAGTHAGAALCGSILLVAAQWLIWACRYAPKLHPTRTFAGVACSTIGLGCMVGSIAQLDWVVLSFGCIWLFPGLGILAPQNLWRRARKSEFNAYFFWSGCTTVSMGAFIVTLVFLGKEPDAEVTPGITAGGMSGLVFVLGGLMMMRQAFPGRFTTSLTNRGLFAIALSSGAVLTLQLFPAGGVLVLFVAVLAWISVARSVLLKMGRNDPLADAPLEVVGLCAIGITVIGVTGLIYLGGRGTPNSTVNLPPLPVTTALADETVQPIWLGRHGYQVLGLASSGDGRRIVSVGFDRVLKVWDRQSGQVARALPHVEEPLGVVVARDGARAYTCHEDRPSILQWDLVSGNPLPSLDGHRGTVRCLSVNSQRDQLASGGDDNTIRIWDLVTASEVRVLTGPDSAINSVAFSPWGIAAGAKDGSVWVWPQGETVAYTLGSHFSPAEAVAVSIERPWLASVSWEGDIRMWDLQERRELWETRFPIRRSGGVQAAFSDGDSRLLVNLGGTVRFFDATDGQHLGRLRGVRARRIALTPDNMVIGSDRGGTLRLSPAVPFAARGSE